MLYLDLTQPKKKAKTKAKAKAEGAKAKETPEQLEADDAEGLTQPKKKAKAAKAANAKCANAQETSEVTPLKKLPIGYKLKKGKPDVSPKSILQFLSAAPIK